MSFCARCGAAAEPGAGFCVRCGAPLAAHAAGEPGGAPAPAAPPTAPAPAATPAAPRYGGFWRRVWAMFLDRLLVAAVAFPFFGVAVLQALRNMDFEAESDPAQGFALLGAIVTLGFAVAALGWLYFALMESSAKQATLGKMLFGVRVTDLAGRRISFGRATARYFSKILSGLVFGLGFLMAAFTAKKQALHDFIAGTLVVREEFGS
jgi:uncharacterized RDD family membrane protein YckC